MDRIWVPAPAFVAIRNSQALVAPVGSVIEDIRIAVCLVCIASAQVPASPIPFVLYLMAIKPLVVALVSWVAVSTALAVKAYKGIVTGCRIIVLPPANFRTDFRLKTPAIRLSLEITQFAFITPTVFVLKVLIAVVLRNECSVRT